VSGDQSICYDSKPSSLTGKPAKGSSGGYDYQWQYATTDPGQPSSWSNVIDQGGIHDKVDYPPTGKLTQTTYYRYKAYNACDTVISLNYVTVKVYAPLTPGSLNEPFEQVIGKGATPDTLESNAAASGGAGVNSYRYQWQQSTDSIHWDNAYGEARGGTDSVYHDYYRPPALTSTSITYYRRAVTSGSCDTVYSNAIKIKVLDTITPGRIEYAGAGDTICYNTRVALTNKEDAGVGMGTFSYLWQKQEKGGNKWDDIPGATDTEYWTDSLKVTTSFRRRVTSGENGPKYSDTVTVYVYDSLYAGKIGANQLICRNTVPDTLTSIEGTKVRGGAGEIRYQWQQMGSSGWDDVGNGNGEKFLPPALDLTAVYRREVTRAACPEEKAYSNSVTVAVRPLLVAGELDSVSPICYDTRPDTLTGAVATGGSGSYRYQWQYTTGAPDKEDSWKDVDDQLLFNTVSYRPSVTLTETTHYRYRVADLCDTVASPHITVTVYPKLTPGTLRGGAQTIVSGIGATPDSLATASDASGGTGKYSYKWLKSSNGSYPWEPTGSGDTLTSYCPPMLTATIYYRRSVTSGSCGPVYTDSVKIEVKDNLTPGTIISKDNGTTICYNTVPSDTLRAEVAPKGGVPNVRSYQWLKKIGTAGEWDIISGWTYDFYVPGALTDTTFFRRVVRSGANGPIATDSITINVYPVLKSGEIRGDQTVCYGRVPDTLTSYIEASGANDRRYQWVQQDKTGKWINVIGGTDATQAEYAPPELDTTTEYRRVVISGTCNTTDTSNIVKVTVYDKLKAGKVNEGVLTICYNTQLTDGLTGTGAQGGKGAYTYRWQYTLTPTNESSWQDVATASKMTGYSPGILTTTTFYRYQVEDGCDTVTSDTYATVKVLPMLTEGYLLEPFVQRIGKGAVPDTLRASAPNGGDGSYTYLWQQSLDMVVWQLARGNDSSLASFAPPALYDTTYYRRTVKSGDCGPETPTADYIMVAVFDTLTAGVIEYLGADTICYNTVPINGFVATIPPMGGMGIFTYQWWQRKKGEATWTRVYGETDPAFTPGPMKVTTTFMREVNSGSNGPRFSDSITIYVLPELNGGTIKEDQTICYNTQPTPLQSSREASGEDGVLTYQWQLWTATSGMWTDVNNGDGFKTATYTPPQLTETTRYRRRAHSVTCGTEAYSNTITVAVRDSLKQDVTGTQSWEICRNDTKGMPKLVPLKVSGGSGNYVYLWEKKVDDSWEPAGGFDTDKTYTPSSVNETDNTIVTEYRRRVTDPTCSPEARYSDVYKITVYSELKAGIISGTQIVNRSQTPDTLVVTTFASGGKRPYAYKWQKSCSNNMNGCWTSADVPNTDSAKYLFAAPLLETTYFRLSVSDGCSTVYTDSVLVTVNDDLKPGSIGDDQIICHRHQPDLLKQLTPATGGNEVYSYIWWRSEDLGATWSKVKGSDGVTQNDGKDFLPNPLTKTTYYYRSVITGEGAEAHSNVVKIVVRDTLIGGTIEGDALVCYGEAPAKIISVDDATGGSVITYRWEQSPNGINAWTVAVDNVNAPEYVPPALKKTTYYRRMVTSVDNCGTDSTNIVKVTVRDSLNQPLLDAPLSQQVCLEGMVPDLKPRDVDGGSGGYRYLWQKKNGTAWEPADGKNDTSIYTPSSANTTFTTLINEYRRMVTDTVCRTDVYSDVYTITVYSVLNPGTIVGSQKVNRSQIPDTLTSAVLASGGTGTYAYLWQQRIPAGSNNWEDADNLNNPNNDPDMYIFSAPLPSSAYFRRQVSDGCSAVYSDSVFIEVTDDLKPGTIGSEHTICYGSQPDSLMQLTPAAGGSEIYVYYWEKKTGLGGSWVRVDGSDGVTIDDGKGFLPNPLTDTTYYRRQIVTSENVTAYSNVVMVAVRDSLVGGIIKSDDDTTCYNNIPQPIISLKSATGGSIISYHWEQSPDGINKWDTVVGATDPDYTPPALTVETYYRRWATSEDNCGTAVSNSVVVRVYNRLTGGSFVNNKSQSVCSGSEIASPLQPSDPSGGCGRYTYLWQQKNADGIWIEAEGANNTSVSYTPPAQTHIDSLPWTTCYRRKVIDLLCDVAYSDSFVVLVYPMLQSGSIGSDQRLLKHQTPAALTSVLAAARGKGGYAYQWEDSSRYTSGWVQMGSTTPTPDDRPFFAPLYVDENDLNVKDVPVIYYYRRSVRDECDTTYSNIITIEVYPDIDPGVIDSDQFICYGTWPDTLKGTVSEGGLPWPGVDRRYQWEGKETGINNDWAPIQGATNKDYGFTAVLTTTTQYRRGVFVVDTMVYSNTITITVHDKLDGGEIDSVPSVCYNRVPNTITSRSLATGGTRISYQWEQSIDGKVWKDIADQMATLPYYAPPALKVTTWFRRRVDSEDGCGKEYSNTVMVEVYREFIPGVLSDTLFDLCEGTTVTLERGNPDGGGAGSGNDYYTYLWEQSPTKDGPWTPIFTGATSNTYVLEGVNKTVKPETTYYRRKVFDVLYCKEEKISGLIAVVVAAKMDGGVVDYLDEGKGIDNGAIPKPLKSVREANGGIGGIDSITYQWEFSLNGKDTWTEIPGATDKDFQPSNLYRDTYYRRRATSSTCAPVVWSNVVMVRIWDPVTPGSIEISGGYGENQSICYNDAPARLIQKTPPTGGPVPPAYFYQWQDSVSNGAAWRDIPGATDEFSYIIENLKVTTYYRRQVRGGGITVYSDPVKVEVYAPLDPGIIGTADTMVCYGTMNVLITSVKPATGGSGTYSGVYNYEWERIDNHDKSISLWKHHESYDFEEPLVERTMFRRRVDDLCGSFYSNSVTIGVYELPSFTLKDDYAELAVTCTDTVFNLATLVSQVASNGPWNLWDITLNAYNDVTCKNQTDIDSTVVKKAGGYYLRAENTLTGCASVAQVINVAPKSGVQIVKEPRPDTAVYQGSPATLSVSATGYGNLQYQWYNANGKINSARSASFDPITTQPGRKSYYVTVSGACGSTVQSDSAEVTVLIPLRIVKGEIAKKIYDKTDTATVTKVTFENMYNNFPPISLVLGRDYVATAQYTDAFKEKAFLPSRTLTFKVQLSDSMRNCYYILLESEKVIMATGNEFGIHQRPLDVIPKSGQWKFYNFPDPPEFLYTINGLVASDYGDAASIIFVKLSREPGEDTGAYRIIKEVPIMVLNSNYVAGYFDPDVMFTILKADLSGTVSIDGNLLDGDTLRANVSKLGSTPPGIPYGTYFYEWMKVDETTHDTTLIGSNNFYCFKAADYGYGIFLRVTSSDLNGYAAAYKEPLPMLIGTLRITGDAVLYGKLTADTAGMESTKFSKNFTPIYEWKRDGVTVGRDRDYIPTNGDVGSTIRLTVTADNHIGARSVSVSIIKAKMEGWVKIDTTGATTPCSKPVVGCTLQATDTVFSSPEISNYGALTYEWWCDGEKIANGKTCPLREEYAGKDVYVTVKASNLREELRSNALIVRKASLTGSVTISVAGGGQPTVGKELRVITSGLTADPSTARPPEGYTYTWLCNNSVVGDENVYTPALGCADTEITVKVKASNLVGEATAKVMIYKAILTGTVSITGEPIVGSPLNVDLTGLKVDPVNAESGAFTYEWRCDGTLTTTGSSYTPALKDTGKVITVTVRAANLRDSVVSDPVTVRKAQLTGTVLIYGNAVVGGSGLTAVTTGLLSNPSGVARGSYRYEWRVDGQPVPGKTTSTYSPIPQSDAEKNITVVVWAANLLDSVVSASVEVRKASLEGTVSIAAASLPAVPGKMLEIDTGSLTTNPSGVLPGSYSYVWMRNGVPVPNATGNTYMLVQADTFCSFTVSVSAMNLDGTITSTKTVWVEKAKLEGTLTISGDSAVGGELEANTDYLVSNPSGVLPGSYSYVWMRNGVPIRDANSEKYQLVQEDAGKTISVRISAVGLTGSVLSNSVKAVKAKLLQGLVVAEGHDTVGSTLSANISLVSNSIQNNVAPGDTLYQWLCDGVPISGATGKSYYLEQEYAGREISVRVSMFNLDSSLTSAARTIEKARLTGTVTVEGEGVVWLPLSITNWPSSTPADVAPGGYTYEWWSGNQRLQAGSSRSYTPKDELVGKEIFVKVYAANLQDTIYSIPVTVRKARLTGVVTISGEAIGGGNELKVNTILFADPQQADHGEYSYVWRRSKDGQVDDVGTDPTYAPKLEDIGSFLTVEVRAANLLDSVVSQSVEVRRALLEGSVQIAGRRVVGDTLRIVTQLYSNPQGVDPGGYLYEWTRNGVIVGRDSIYKPELEDVGSAITITVSAKNLQQALTSDPVVIRKAKLAGMVTFDDIPIVGNLLSVDASGVESAPLGVLPGNLVYEWRCGGTELTVKGSSYTPELRDTGKVITVTVRAENLDSFLIALSARVEKAQLDGSVSVDGAPTVADRQLEVNTTALYSTPQGVDAGGYLYEWTRKGVTDVVVGREKTYTPTYDDVGSPLIVSVRTVNLSGVKTFTTDTVDRAWLDQQRTTVTVVSAEGKERDTVGHLLEAIVDQLFTDPQGVPVGDLHYRWYRDNNELIEDANDRQYRLVPADTIGNIIVEVWTSNLQGSISSAVVEDVYKAMLRGTVQIVGVDTVGYTLTAETDLTTSPLNVPLGEVRYQWKRDDKLIDGARQQTYRPTPLDIGTHISVTVSASNLEGSVTSAPTGIISDTSYCGNGVKNENCPDYLPGFFYPGNGGDTNYCGNGIMNIDCPDYPDYIPDKLVDTLELNYGGNEPSLLSLLNKYKVSAGDKWFSLSETIVSVKGSNAVIEGAGITHLLYYKPPVGKNSYSEVLLSIPVRVKKRPLIIGKPHLQTTKPYDMTTAVAFVKEGSIKGYLPQDKDKVSVQTIATYDDANIGNRYITVEYELTGERAHCYEAAPRMHTVQGRIVDPRDIIPGSMWGVVQQLRVSENGETTYVPWDGLVIRYKVGQKEGQVSTVDGVYSVEGLNNNEVVIVMPPIVSTYTLLGPSQMNVPVSGYMTEAPIISYLQEPLMITAITFKDAEDGRELDHWERERGEMRISNDTIFYRAPCGVEQLEVTYIPADGVVGWLKSGTAEESGLNSFKVDLDAFEQKAAVLQLTSSSGLSKPYTVVVERDFGLFDIVNEHMNGSIRVVQNNPTTNKHGMTFENCIWYLKREGDDDFQEVGSGLHYKTENAPYEGFSPTDSMKLVLYTTDGKRVETCPDASVSVNGGSVNGSNSQSRQQSGLTVYPNPVSPGGIVKLRRDDFVDSEKYIMSAKFYLFDSQGRLIRTGSASALYGSEGLVMPETPGIYHLVLETTDGRRRNVKIAVGGY
jgi:hypothetical protein